MTMDSSVSESFDTNKRIYITTNDYSTNADNRTIYPDMTAFDIPDNIKRYADKLYNQADIPINRKKKRRLMIYYFLDCAYNDLGISFNPKQLASIVGINPTEVRTATSKYSRYNTSYKPN